MKTHIVPTSGDAYDSAQCGQNVFAEGIDMFNIEESPSVDTGDTLVSTEDEVVGISHCWPIAVTVNHGALHRTKLNTLSSAIDYLCGGIGSEGISRQQASEIVAHAVAEANARSWPIIAD